MFQLIHYVLPKYTIPLCAYFIYLKEVIKQKI